VTQLLTAWAAEGYRDDAALLISELVTNVVRHVAGEAAMTVEVHLTRAALHVAVVRRLHRARGHPTPHGGGRHGLWLVAAVADRWGSEEHARGKRVWFELRRAA
jgi:two-component sensor histidine kinase